ncbi:aflatoxin B1-aldehyde reductase [Trametopsis cervina]|nr:aflatoxin B1-aldehyde reductase [Trametopsis cervina]
MAQASRIPLILGAGMWGHPGTTSRIQDTNTAQKLVDALLKYDHYVVDTGRIYAEGTSEKVIGSLDLRGRARVDTKIFPVQPGDHGLLRLKEAMKVSIDALGPHKIRVFYLHAPDRHTPFEETLEATNELYNDGCLFARLISIPHAVHSPSLYSEELGLSNYASWEVAEIVGICERRGFKKPTVYQGIYNLLDRTSEGELFPCLRKFGIRFAAYSTLAGGYLTGKHLDPMQGSVAATEHKYSHFNPELSLASFFTTRYPPMAETVKRLQDVARKHDLTLTEVAYRWLQWHSRMIPSDAGVIIGASTVEQFEAAVVDSSKGPLPQEVVDACQQTWLDVRGIAKNYWLEDSVVKTIETTN